MNERFIIIKTVDNEFHCGLMERGYNLISIDTNRVKFNKTCIPFNRIAWIKSDLFFDEYKAIIEDLGITGNADYIKSLLDYNTVIGSNPKAIKLIAYLQGVEY